VIKSFKRKWLLSLIIFSVCNTSASAYTEDYPPYKFKDGPPKHLRIRALKDIQGDLSNGKYEYKSDDGKIIVKAAWAAQRVYSLLIRDGGFVLVDEEMDMYLKDVYRTDIDGNGLEDFIVFKNYMGQGSGALRDMVEIYLKEKEGVYHRIEYDSDKAGLEDFVDLNGDGKYSVLIEGESGWNDASAPEIFHTCSTYDVYEFKDFKLVNANVKFKGFPKFVWWKFKPNDEDAAQMTKEARKKATQDKDASISYQTITSVWRGDASGTES
jgi:hypothetical protein